MLNSITAVAGCDASMLNSNTTAGIIKIKNGEKGLYKIYL
jgi:hypothetical protein